MVLLLQTHCTYEICGSKFPHKRVKYKKTETNRKCNLIILCLSKINVIIINSISNYNSIKQLL